MYNNDSCYVRMKDRARKRGHVVTVMPGMGGFHDCGAFSKQGWTAYEHPPHLAEERIAEIHFGPFDNKGKKKYFASWFMGFIKVPEECVSAKKRWHAEYVDGSKT